MCPLFYKRYNRYTRRILHAVFITLFSTIFCTSAAHADLNDITRIYHTPLIISNVNQQSQIQFEICSGGGCATSHIVTLSLEELAPIAEIYAAPKLDGVDEAEIERTHIALAIGALENIIGLKTNTSQDRAGTFNNSAYRGQLDCNDEAINSTTYMRLLVAYGFVQYHTVEDTRTRNFFFTGWPHSTAVMHENASGKRYAVDSWFYDNGAPATILPFEKWKSGFIPADSPIIAPRK